MLHRNTWFMLALLAFLIILAIPLQAATRTWGGATGAWNTPAKWVGGVIPTADDDVVLTGTLPSSLGAAAYANSITIKTAAVATTITDATYALTIGAGGITAEVGAGKVTFAFATTLTIDQVWNINSTNGLQFNKVISGNKTITHNGSGQIIANIANTFGTSTIQLNAGTLSSNVANATTGATINVSGGTVKPTTANALYGTTVILNGGDTSNGTLDISAGNSHGSSALTGATIIFDNAGTQLGTIQGFTTYNNIAIAGDIQVHDNGLITGGQTNGSDIFNSLTFTGANKTLVFNWSNTNVADYIKFNSVNLSANSGTINNLSSVAFVSLAAITGNNANTLTYTGAGAGYLRLTNDNSTTWSGSGGLIINSGSVVLSAANSLGTTSGTTVNDGVLSTTAASAINNATVTINGGANSHGTLDTKEQSGKRRSKRRHYSGFE